MWERFVSSAFSDSPQREINRPVCASLRFLRRFQTLRALRIARCRSLPWSIGGMDERDNSPEKIHRARKFTQFHQREMHLRSRHMHFLFRTTRYWIKQASRLFPGVGGKRLQARARTHAHVMTHTHTRSRPHIHTRPRHTRRVEVSKIHKSTHTDPDLQVWSNRLAQSDTQSG